MDLPESLHPGVIDELSLGRLAGRAAGGERDVAVQRVVRQTFVFIIAYGANYAVTVARRPMANRATRNAWQNSEANGTLLPTKLRKASLRGDSLGFNYARLRLASAHGASTATTIGP